MNVSGTKEVLVERLLKHFSPGIGNSEQPEPSRAKSELSEQGGALLVNDELAKMKEKMENMQRIIGRQEREIQKLKSTGTESRDMTGMTLSQMPIPSHAVAFKQGFHEFGRKLNRNHVFNSPEVSVCQHFRESFSNVFSRFDYPLV